MRYPDLVPRAAVFAGTARTPVHNQIVIDTHVPRSDPEFRNGFYDDAAHVHVGLRRLAVAFSLMGLSAAFWRDELWREPGFVSADDFRQGFIRGGDLAALGRIDATFFVAPFSDDLFFPP